MNNNNGPSIVPNKNTTKIIICSISTCINNNANNLYLNNNKYLLNILKPKIFKIL